MPALLFDLASKRIATMTTPASPVAVFSDLLTDVLYVADGTAVKAVGAGAQATGLWRTKRLVLNNYPGYAWARVNARFATGVVLRLYADGALFYTTPVLMSRDPVRLPAGQHKRWEVEIESADRVTSVAIASTSEELL